MMGTGFTITMVNRPCYSYRQRSFSLERYSQREGGRPWSSSDHSSSGSSSTCYSSHCMYPKTVQNCYAGPRIVPSTPCYQPLEDDLIGSVSGNLGAIIYKPNVLGMRGPRKMKVLIPRPSKDKRTPAFCVGKTLLQKYKDRDTSDIIMLTSKDAEWDKELKSYVLNYHGRASQVIQDLFLIFFFMEFLICCQDPIFCQTPVLGLGLGVDTTFPWDNNNNNTPSP